MNVILINVYVAIVIIIIILCDLNYSFKSISVKCIYNTQKASLGATKGFVEHLKNTTWPNLYLAPEPIRTGSILIMSL